MIKNVLLKEPTKETPGINFDIRRNIFEIYGRSLPEDVNAFYDIPINWLREYAKKPNVLTNFIFKLEYYNSASVRKIVDILLILNDIYKSGYKVKIAWLYESYDESMGEVGEDFRILVDAPFEIRPINGDVN